MTDLTSKPWIVAKGAMFAVIVVLGALGVMTTEEPWLELTMLVACIWAACRFYYFLFHVLERYVGWGGRYAGLFELCRRLWRRA